MERDLRWERIALFLKTNSYMRFFMRDWFSSVILVCGGGLGFVPIGFAMGFLLYVRLCVA